MTEWLAACYFCGNLQLQRVTRYLQSLEPLFLHYVVTLKGTHTYIMPLQPSLFVYTQQTWNNQQNVFAVYLYAIETWGIGKRVRQNFACCALIELVPARWIIHNAETQFNWRPHHQQSSSNMSATLCTWYARNNDLPQDNVIFIPQQTATCRTYLHSDHRRDFTHIFFGGS